MEDIGVVKHLAVQGEVYDILNNAIINPFVVGTAAAIGVLITTAVWYGWLQIRKFLINNNF